MAQVRKSQFWLDNAAGTLTEFTSSINQVSGPKRAVEELENTHLNEDDKSFVAGIRDAVVQGNGFYDDSATGLYRVLQASLGTSTSKTFQKKVGSRYENGEVWVTALDPSEDGKKLSMFSFTLRVDGAVNSTTVALS